MKKENQPPKNSWEKEFDRQFCYKDSGDGKMKLLVITCFADNYKSFIRQLLSQTRQEETDKYLFMSRKLAELVRKETIKETIKETLKAVLEIIDKVYKKEKGIHNWLDLREKIRQRKV